MAKLDNNTQLDVSNKMSLSVGSTTNDKNWFEELYNWAPQLDWTDVFAEDVPIADTPAQADANVSANPTMLQKLDHYQLTEMPATNGQGYGIYATPGNTSSQRYKNFILPQKYGSGYSFYLYDGNDNPIALTDGAYQFDYANGILRFDPGHTPSALGWALPLKITVYRYIGKTLKDGTGGSTNPEYWRDPVAVVSDDNYADAASLPTGAPYTYDGYTIQDGDAVLFKNITAAADDDRVYIAAVDGSGNVTSWTLRTDGVAGDGSPTAGEQLTSIYGNTQAGYRWGYNGTDWTYISSSSVLSVGGCPNPAVTSGIDTIIVNDGIRVVIDGNKAVLHAPEPPETLGSTDLTSDATFFTGALSAGNANYDPAAPAGTVVDNIVNVAHALMKFTHVAEAYANADVGITKAVINGTDAARLDNPANFVEANRSTQQSMQDYDNQGSGDPVTDGVVDFVGSLAGTGNLTVTSVKNDGGCIDSSMYQHGTAEINITNTGAWRQGYNEIALSHNGISSNIFKLFFDDDTGPDPSISGADLLLGSATIKHLSGVPYYDANTTFNFSCDGNDVFDNVYHQSGAPIVLSGFPGVSDQAIMYNDPSVSGVSDPPHIGETMHISNYQFTVSAGQEDNNVRVTATPRDPYGSYTSQQTPDHGYSVMSVAAISTRTMEYFVDENWRFPSNTNFNSLPASTTGNWDSTILLSSSTAGYNDGLQSYDEDDATPRRLIHPQVDYTNANTGRNPDGPDYTSLSSTTNRVYYRVFQGVIDNSNGIIAVPGLANSDLTSGNVKIEIKVPTKTMWLDVWKDYNASTFNTNAAYPGGTDGEGCRINPSVHSPDLDGTIEFTLGPYASDSSVNRLLFIKVTYANNATAELQSGFGITNW